MARSRAASAVTRPVTARMIANMSVMTLGGSRGWFYSMSTAIDFCRERRRWASNLNKHPQTKRSYLLRTYMFCDLCGRRMQGRAKRDTVYYVCAPKKGNIAPGHPGPAGFWVREDLVVDKLNDFLATHVFGTHREVLLGTQLRERAEHARQVRNGRLTALRSAISEAELARKNALRPLELTPEPDQDLIRDVNERRAELRQEQDRLETELRALEQQASKAPNPDLLAALPTGDIDINELPESLAREVFEALQLELRFDDTTNRLTCRITLTGPTVLTAQHVAHRALRHRRQKKGSKTRPGPPDGRPGRICNVPPTGYTTDPPTSDLGLCGSLVIETTGPLPTRR